MTTTARADRIARLRLRAAALQEQIARAEAAPPGRRTREEARREWATRAAARDAGRSQLYGRALAAARRLGATVPGWDDPSPEARLAALIRWYRGHRLTPR